MGRVMAGTEGPFTEEDRRKATMTRNARWAHHARRRAIVRQRPAGWTEGAYQAYLEDPDGGRAACRLEYVRLPPADNTPTNIEIESRMS